MKRHYYKSKDNTGFLNLKSALIDENYIQITKEEFEELANDVIQTNLIDKITDSIDYKHRAHQVVQAFIQIVQLILAR